MPTDTPYDRCTAESSQGRRCWLLPGHEGKHLLMSSTPAQARLSGHRIMAERSDVTDRAARRELLRHVLYEQGQVLADALVERVA